MGSVLTGELVPWETGGRSHWGPSEKPYELTLEPDGPRGSGAGQPEAYK